MARPKKVLSLEVAMILKVNTASQFRYPTAALITIVLDVVDTT